jgi:FKBP-type peptidyl-prolyl cis-trans isomerase
MRRVAPDEVRRSPTEVSHMSFRVSFSSSRLRSTYSRVAMLAIIPLAMGCAATTSGVSASTARGLSKLDATPRELQKTDVKQGAGAEAISGKTVVVHYTGWLYDTSKPDSHGAKFDSSRDRNAPFTFVLGAGRVIKGWDEGVAGMKVGGQRRLVIPPDFGYGARGAGGVIPPNATLIFDVELLAVQ